MILTDAEIEERLNSVDNVAALSVALPVRVEPLYKGGNRSGSAQLRGCPEVKAFLGALASVESQSSIAETFGVSQPLVGHYQRGLDGAGSVDEELRDRVNDILTVTAPPVVSSDSKSKLAKAHDLALDSLVAVLSELPTRTRELKAKDLSKVAADMSKIVQNVNGGLNINGNGNRVQVIVMRQEQRVEGDFDFIEA